MKYLSSVEHLHPGAIFCGSGYAMKPGCLIIWYWKQQQTTTVDRLFNALVFC